MISIFKQTLAAAIIILTVGACSALEEPTITEFQQTGKHVSKMIFQGAVSGYEGTTVRDVSTKGSSSWSEGDLLYIAFYNGDDIIPGTAVFSSTDGWMISYDGDLADGSSQRCEVRFFVNATFANENIVSMNSNTEIYEDVAGTFNYSDGYITVNANLTPKVGRIRFTGNADDKIHITGITTHTTYSPAGNKFSTTIAMIPLTVDASGSTPYVYGFFTNEDRKLGMVGSDFAFTRTCKASVFQAGESGYMKIPSSTSHMNWKTGLTVTVNGVDFKMLPVAGYSGGFFLLAETETTNALYNAVTGTGASDNLPCTKGYSTSTINSYYWQFFIQKLNYTTSLPFYIPTKDEWEFAATGGTLSQGYTYSGSNIPGDVAWYAGNSGSSMHEVKMLSPNELGFYDMSGNVDEWTQTQTEYNNDKYVMGGSFNSTAESVTSHSSGYGSMNSSSSSSSYGLRLALRCD